MRFAPLLLLLACKPAPTPEPEKEPAREPEAKPLPKVVYYSIGTT